jgi:hypothetical protein
MTQGHAIAISKKVRAESVNCRFIRRLPVIALARSGRSFGEGTMPQHVVVVFVHGIHNQRVDFAKPMREALQKQLPKGLVEYVTFATVNWANKVRDKQHNYLNRAKDAEGIVANWLRVLLVEGLGDAAAYQKSRYPENSSYADIQACISEVLVAHDSTRHKDRPLILIGHSLGCHIISSYAWDMNKLRQRTETQMAGASAHEQAIWKMLQKASAFRRLETFAGFVTLGSNMPLFTFSFGTDRVFPITFAPPGPDGNVLTPAFPGPKLDPTRLKQARWLNFFSKRDVLGFPLKPLYHSEHLQGRLFDIPVKTARTVPVWGDFAAHLGYWKNTTVIEETANLICEVVG